jgi:hypothetical protein
VSRRSGGGGSGGTRSSPSPEGGDVRRVHEHELARVGRGVAHATLLTAPGERSAATRCERCGDIGPGSRSGEAGAPLDGLRGHQDVAAPAPARERALEAGERRRRVRISARRAAPAGVPWSPAGPTGAPGRPRPEAWARARAHTSAPAGGDVRRGPRARACTRRPRSGSRGPRSQPQTGPVVGVLVAVLAKIVARLRAIVVERVVRVGALGGEPALLGQAHLLVLILG